MPDELSNDQQPTEAAEAARLAGWNPADGPSPYGHALPPADALLPSDGNS